MKASDVQNTTWLGSSGLVAAVVVARSVFQDVPVEDFFSAAQTLSINDALDMLIPLVLGTLGIVYDEDKKEKITKPEAK